MGGKQKNRTKGNTKPSSSSRAAELLASDSGIGKFVGFGSSSVLVKENPFDLDTNDVETQDDNNFRLLFKKMTKKDSVTKIKALKDFYKFCEVEDVENVKATLPYWVKIYPKLALDPDWTVRENCFKCMEKLVSKLKKDMTPCLKQLMPTWLISLHDPYGPACQAAQISFKSAFHGDKVQKALLFAKEEILKFCTDELIRNDEYSSSKKVAVSDDLCGTTVILKSSCLGALEMLLCQLPGQDDILEQIRFLLQTNEFWALRNHEETCSLWYKLMRTIFKRHPQAITQFTPKFCREVFSRITEKNSTISFAVWETIASLVDSLENCWAIIDTKKFVNDFCNVLKNQGNVYASRIFPYSVSLIKNIPPHILSEDLEIQVLESFSQGLQSSEFIKSDFDLTVSCYFDCIKYFLVELDAAKNEKKTKVKDRVINVHFRRLLSHYLSAPHIAQYCSAFFTETIKLLQSSKPCGELFLAVENCVICVLTTIYRQALKESKTRNLECLLIFIQRILPSIKSHSKERRRVNFSDDSSLVKNVEKISKSQDDKSLSSELVNIVHSLMLEVLQSKNCEDSTDIEWIKFVNNLCKYQQVLTVLSPDETQKFVNLLVSLIHKTVAAVDKIPKPYCLSILLDTAFAVSESSTGTDALIAEVTKVRDPALMELFLTYVNDHQTERSFDKWVQSAHAVDYVVYVAESLMQILNAKTEIESPNWNSLWNSLIISFSLKSLSPNCFDVIVTKFDECIKKSDVQCVDLICQLTEKLFNTYEPFHTLPSISSLLLNFFKLSSYENTRRHQLCDVWTFGLKSTLRICNHNPDDSEIVKIICKYINAEISGLNQRRAVLMIDNIMKLISVVTEYMDSLKTTSHECDITSSEKIILAFFPLMFPYDSYIPKESSSLTKFALYLSCLDGTFQVLDSFTEGYSNEDVLKCEIITSAFVPLQIINACIEGGYVNAENLGALINHVEEFCVVVAYCKQLLPFINWLPVEYTTLIPQVLSLFKKLSSFLNDEIKVNILKLLWKRCVDEEHICLFAFKFFLDECYNKVTCWSHISEEALYKNLALFQVASCMLSEETCLNLFTTALETLNDDHRKLTLIPALLKSSHPKSSENISLVLRLCKTLLETMNEETLLKTNDSFILATRLIDVHLCVLSNWLSEISPEQLDFVLCSLTTWATSFTSTFEIASNSSIIPVFLFRLSSLVLMVTEKVFLTNFSQIAEEWEKFHAKKIFVSMLDFMRSVKENKNTISLRMNWVLVAVGGATVKLCEIASLDLAEGLRQDEASESSRFIEELALDLSLLMAMNIRSMYFTAYTVLMRIVPLLSKNLVINESIEQEKSFLEPPAFLLNVLKQTDTMVDAILSDYRVAEHCCIIDPSTDSYHCVLSYLLNWRILVEYFSHLTPETRSFFSDYLTEKLYFSKMMNSLFRLMPVHDDFSSDSNLFIIPFIVNTHSSASAMDVQHIACQLYYDVLKKMPASVRQWTSNQEKRTSQLVNRFTTNNVSSFICSEEFQTIQKFDQSNLKNMSIRARPSAREVLTIYSIEDMSLELTIRLPPNYPLNAVTVDGEKRVGVSSSQWRTWMLQLTTFLTHQNGSIMDGLTLWNRNINKRFEGLDECMICFYILHGSTCQLPKLSCRNCRKKAHSACLYKWFKTSNNPTCPLCRNLF